MRASPGRHALAEALRHVGVQGVPAGLEPHDVRALVRRRRRSLVRDLRRRTASTSAPASCSAAAGTAPASRTRGVAYVPTLAAWLRATGRWVATGAAAPGDIAVYDWDGGVPDHVGIVDPRRAAATLETVEGNTASATTRTAAR